MVSLGLRREWVRFRVVFVWGLGWWEGGLRFSGCGCSGDGALFAVAAAGVEYRFPIFC